MKNAQKITTLFFILLVFGAYFGCETKSKQQKGLEKSRALNFETLSPKNLVKDQKGKISNEQLTYINALEVELESVESDSESILILEQLASTWFSIGSKAISGIYAEEIAKKTETSKVWGMVGTTYLLALKEAKDQNLADFCQNRSIKALEKAISYEPNNIDHQLNLAMCYVEKPLSDNPMKGILMLVEMNKKAPENIKVLLKLAKLALQTNQIEKATQRLLSVVNLEPEHNEAHCLLGQIFKNNNKQSEATFHLERCN